MNELQIDNLVRVEQLPKIISQLEQISEWVDDGSKKLDLDNLVCTEDNKQEIKKTRAEIKKISTTLETRRKEIKNQILEPYTIFEDKYNNCIKSKLNEADNRLGEAIKEVEDNQKAEKEIELREFFNNYTERYNLTDMFTFEQVGLNITLSASMSLLKELIKGFVETRNKDIQAINSSENKEELMLEYQINGFDYVKATMTINERHKMFEQMKQQLENKQKTDIIEEENVKKVDEIIEPTVLEEEKLTVAFEIVATRNQIRELKEFFKVKGIEYR